VGGRAFHLVAKAEYSIDNAIVLALQLYLQFTTWVLYQIFDAASCLLLPSLIQVHLRVLKLVAPGRPLAKISKFQKFHNFLNLRQPQGCFLPDRQKVPNFTL
jgi:hypothetical protein